MAKAGRRTLLGLTALAGSVAWRFQRDLAQARRRALAGARMIETEAGPIEYAESGRGAPVLMIHGAAGGHDQGLIVGRDLPEGSRVIAPSRFGYLRTPVPADRSQEAQADAHAALLDALGVDRAIVTGMSAGAVSALHLALRHPHRVRALLLLVPRFHAPDREEAIPRALLTDAAQLAVEALGDFAFWTALRLARSRVLAMMGVPPMLEARAIPEERRRMQEFMEAVLPFSDRAAGLRIDGEAPLVPLPLGRITAPTLIVTTPDDGFNTLAAGRYIAGLIPSARLVVMADGGHLMVGRRAEVMAAVADFFHALARDADA